MSAASKGPRKRKERRKDQTSPEPAAEQPPAPAYAPMAEANLRATAARMQDVHRALADSTFDALQANPMLALHSRLMQGAHDALTDAVYAGMRHGGTAWSSLAAGMERAASDASRSPHEADRVWRDALNAAVGETLHQAANPLGITMQMLVGGRALESDASLLAGLGSRVVVFLHGLGNDEHSWARPHGAWRKSEWAGQGAHYGDLLQAEEGLSPIFLRYNTGRSIADNGLLFSEQMSRLLEAAPQIEHVVLIGHSMGGLVARAACDHALNQGATWPARTALLICLGSPHHGAPLEQLSRLTSTALAAGQLAGKGAAQELARGHDTQVRVPLRFVSANVADESHGVAGELVGHMLGDGMVQGAPGADGRLVGDVERVELKGLSHMALLHHPRVYRLLRDWIHAALPPA